MQCYAVLAPVLLRGKIIRRFVRIAVSRPSGGALSATGSEESDGHIIINNYGKSRKFNFSHNQDVPLGKVGILLPLLKGVGRFARDQANDSPDTPYREVT